MDKLVFTFEGREITAPLEVIFKRHGLYEYHLLGKDRRRIFVFIKNGNQWFHHYGHMRDDLKEVIISALIMRFESDIVTTFFYKGERQIVTVGFANGSGQWFVMINHFFKGSISYNTRDKNFIWHIHNPGGWLLPRHMEKFVEMIKQGKIESPDEYRSYILPLQNDSTGT